MTVRQQSKWELAAAVQVRYLKADKRGKARLLDEFVASTDVRLFESYSVAGH